MIDIASNLLANLSEHVCEVEARERCGVIMSDGEVVEIENIHAEPEEGFHMEPKTFLAYVENGATATWHTHPGADPNLSHEDLNGFRQWPQLDHHIVGIRDGKPAVHSFKVVDGIVVNA